VQILSEEIRVTIGQESFNCDVGFSPDGNGRGQQPASLGGQRHDTAAAVRGVDHDLKRTPTLQGLESGGQRCPIYSEQRRYRSHVGWLWTV